MTREEKLANIAGDLGLSVGKVGRAIFRLCGPISNCTSIDCTLYAHVREVEALRARLHEAAPESFPSDPILNGTNPKGDARLLADIAAGTATAAQDAPGDARSHADAFECDFPLVKPPPHPDGGEGDRFENAGGGNREDIK